MAPFLSLILWMLIVFLGFFRNGFFVVLAESSSLYSTTEKTAHAAINAQGRVYSSSDGSEGSRFDQNVSAAPETHDMPMNDGHAFGVTQNLVNVDDGRDNDDDTDDDILEDFQNRLRETERYMQGQPADSCANMHSMCTIWSVQGECDENPDYMNTNCAPACQTCHLRQPKRRRQSRQKSQEDTPLKIGPGSDFGVVQVTESTLWEESIVQAKLEETAQYMKGKLFCSNRKSMCTLWALNGECEENAKFMAKQCAPACGKCSSANGDEKSPVTGIAKPKSPDSFLEQAAAEMITSEDNVSSLCRNQPEKCSSDFGTVQLLEYDDYEEDIDQQVLLQRLHETKIYMDRIRRDESFSPEILGLCSNRDEKCTLWAVRGDCRSAIAEDREHMIQHCAPVCQTCHELTLNMFESDDYDNEDELHDSEQDDDDEEEEYEEEEYEEEEYEEDGDDEEEEYEDDDDEEEDEYKEVEQVDEYNQDSEIVDKEIMDEDNQEPQVPVGEGPGSLFGLVQGIDKEWEVQILAKLKETRLYMEEKVYKDEAFSKVREACRNQYVECTMWAVQGECQANPGFMIVNCAPACQTCEMVDSETRCAINPEDPDAWKAGDLNRMFERIVEQYGTQVTVVSRPDYVGNDEKFGKEKETAPYEVGPWILMLDDFITEEEANRLIELGTELGYERSSGVGNVDPLTGAFESVETPGRTSTNAWCGKGCEDDPIVMDVWERIENLTGIPKVNSEKFQLLKYEEGQFYNTHHDYIEHEATMMQGPRILTVFMYLSTVEGGGETRFAWFGDRIRVKAKLGRAVLWPSVLDETPWNVDDRTEHQAMPVRRGRKYAANAWYHLRSVKQAADRGC